ncbi:adenylyltransferase/cytidyltransferase family protein [Qipengyuania marisflavi]|uniref:Glycerol-3-phosphate cytidylyltransferase n=1 Tax=Qipengyuania marisflavi TaxID=2486356 RepID=A0A5S3PAW3_9SPHN|nr:adenylyltransferase/cytidyltransferase family protein [Qipengyuania marisflavi]TMM50523.1 glycerol-3-phosphate cytidylyltransferase [Qipengyuania marisflavi]
MNQSRPRKTVLTYGTFDLFHIGHLRLIERLAALGDRLIVGVSTDGFNAGKGKHSLVPYEDRAAIVAALRQVDAVIAEDSWDQKERDIAAHSVDIFGMGGDWRGQFDHLSELCEVVYLDRTEGISTTTIRGQLIPRSSQP